MNYKNRTALFTIAASVASATPSWATSTTRVKAIFAKHDPERRIDHTSIKRLGIIRTRKSAFAVYLLNFTNPISHHGLQRIAVIRDGSTFIGSQQCAMVSIGQIKVERDRVAVTMDGMTSLIRFRAGRPVPDRYFCGEESRWEHVI